MKDEDKTKGQLLEELVKLREQIIKFERSEAEQKKPELDQQISEELYKTLLKTSPDAIAIHDLEDKIIEVSRRWLEIWGFETAKEVIGRIGFEFIAPKTGKRQKKTFRNS